MAMIDSDDFDELLLNAPIDVLYEFKQRKSSEQVWKKNKKEHIKSLFNAYVKFQFVPRHYYKLLEQVCNLILHNIAKLYGNTLLVGHTEEDPEEYFNELKFSSEDMFEFYDYVKDNISDYGLPKLMTLARRLVNCRSEEEKLITVSRILNVIHMRNDLAALFIEGGSKALQDIGGQIHESLNDNDLEDLPKVYFGDSVCGLVITKAIPNYSSIAASFTNYRVLPGIRKVSISLFDQDYVPVVTNRVKQLAEKIFQTKTIDPLIIVKDSEGLYVLEGGHRYDALKYLKVKELPAIVVIDEDE